MCKCIKKEHMDDRSIDTDVFEEFISRFQGKDFSVARALCTVFPSRKERYKWWSYVRLAVDIIVFAVYREANNVTTRARKYAYVSGSQSIRTIFSFCFVPPAGRNIYVCVYMYIYENMWKGSSILREGGGRRGNAVSRTNNFPATVVSLVGNRKGWI